MLLMYVIFAPILIALAAGTFLFAWSQHKGSGFGKFMGALITLFALILLALQAWQTSKMWQDGRMIKKEVQKMMQQMPETMPSTMPAKK